MKILIDLTSLADNFSGIERYAASMSLELIGHEEHDFILVFKEKVHFMFARAVEKSNIEVVVLKRCNKLLFNQIRLLRALRKHPADVYLFMAFPIPQFFCKTNSVATVHDLCAWDCPETMTTLSKWYFRMGIKHSVKTCKNLLVTVSEFSKKRIADKFNLSADKILVTYDGIGNDFMRKSCHASRDEKIDEKYGLPEKYILSLSTIEPRKNIGLLLRAYASLIEDGKNLPELVLAGRSGWKNADLLENIPENVKERIHFTGFIENAHLAYIYGRADVFVFPSKYEGFGLPPLEAMACGAPVLSSDAASLPEVLGDVAMYFSNNDIGSLKSKLVEILNIDNERKEELSIAGHERAMMFDWGTEAAKLLGAIERFGNAKYGEKERR